MKKGMHNKQVGIPTVGFVFANAAHMRRFVRSGTENQARTSFSSSLFRAGYGERLS